MKEFIIYENSIKQCVALKNGWSWAAFFLNWLWAFYKRIPEAGILGLIINIAIMYYHQTQIVPYMHSANFNTNYLIILLAIILLVNVAFGANGNKWVAGKWINKGYSTKDIISANSSQEAIAIYLGKGKSNPTNEVQENNLDSDTKSCPFCGEIIKKVAIKCRYCKSNLEEQGA